MTMRVKTPDGKIAEFPDGTPPEAIERALAEKFPPPQADPVREALIAKRDALDQQLEPSPASSGALGAIDTLSFGLSDEANAGLDSLFGDEYDDSLRSYRQQASDAREANPKSYMGGQIGGALIPMAVTMGASGPASLGTGALRAMATGGASGTLSGFGSGEGGFKPRAENAVVPGLLGAVTGGVTAKALPLIRTNKIRAQNLIQELLDRKPLARTDLADLGPDAIVADVLGKRGRNAVTKYTGISEDAHDIMSQATGPRLANRDELLEETLLRANERNKPIRREAYEKAAKSGEDLAMTDPGYVPLPKGFEEILAHPVAKDAYAKAESIVEGFKIAKDSTGGELARLDMTQRLLQDWAEVAMKNGNKTNAELYGSFANAIKEKADTMVPDYPVARKVAESFAKEKEALIKQSEAATKVFKKTEKAVAPRVTAPTPMFPNITNVTAGLLSKINLHMKRANASKADRKQAPEIARILASKEIPDKLKEGLVSKLLKGAPISGGLLSNIQYGGPR